MNRPSAVLVTVLVLASVKLFAREPQGPPSPAPGTPGRSGTTGLDGGGISLFVGHYGEALKFPSNWAADAELHGETEAVFFHRKFEDKFEFTPFRPKASDYEPENITPMGLMELIVIPRNSPGGLGSLAAIRSRKELELKKNGAEYRIIDETGEKGWPRATFHVSISKPYRLWQTYSQSPGEFYILTVGGAIGSGEFGLDQVRIENFRTAKELVSDSLIKHIQALELRTPAGGLFRFRDDAAQNIFSRFGNFIRYDGSMPAAMPMTAFGVVLLILAMWPRSAPGSRRVRLVGRSILFFTLLSGFLGFLAVYLPARFADALWTSSDLASTVPLPLLPAIGWAVARRLRSSKVGRISISMAALAVAWTVILLWGATRENHDPTAIMISGNTFVLLVVGLTFGIVFAAAFGPLPDQGISR